MMQELVPLDRQEHEYYCPTCGLATNRYAEDHTELEIHITYKIPDKQVFGRGCMAAMHVVEVWLNVLKNICKNR